MDTLVPAGVKTALEHGGPNWWGVTRLRQVQPRVTAARSRVTVKREIDQYLLAQRLKHAWLVLGFFGRGSYLQLTREKGPNIPGYMALNSKIFGSSSRSGFDGQYVLAFSSNHPFLSHPVLCKKVRTE